MTAVNDEIEEARVKVAHCRLRAERPGSRIEDDLALERARNRLLTLELRDIKRGSKVPVAALPGQKFKRTKQEQLPMSSRARADRAFADLQKNSSDPETGRIKKGES